MPTADAPWFILVAGINGAGKSTFSQDQLVDESRAAETSDLGGLPLRDNSFGIPLHGSGNPHLAREFLRRLAQRRERTLWQVYGWNGVEAHVRQERLGRLREHDWQDRGASQDRVLQLLDE